MRRRIVAAVVVTLSVLALGGPRSARAALERVGPVDPATGYPQWYQDTSGLILDFCGPASDAAEYAGGWCLLLPGTVPNGPPEVAFSNWSVEHFYWAGNSNINGIAPNGVGFKSKLVLSVEGSFAGLTVVPGAQITFARIRIFIPSAPVSGDYYIYHPFGVMVVPGQVAGSRVFFTQDVGLGCAPGRFDCVLATPIGPFLLPSATPGGAELPPLATGATAGLLDPFTGCVNGTVPAVCDPFFPAPSQTSLTGFPGTGKLYLADPARNGAVTGSPLAPFVSSVDGLTYDPNRFRIEVVQTNGVRIALGDTTLFAVTGRVFNQAVPGRVTVDRASYARSATTPNKLDVYVTALPTVQGRVPPSLATPPVQPQLVYYDAACGVDPTGALTVPVDPLTGLALPQNAMNSAVGWKYVVGQSQPAVIPGAVCVEQTNAVNVAGQTVPLFAQTAVTDQVFITQAQFNPNTSALSVQATSSDQLFPPLLTVGGYGDLCVAAPCANPAAVPGQLLVSPLLAPPNKVTVTSGAGGLDTVQVSTLYFTAPVSNVPVATNDAFLINEDCSPTASITPCPVPPVFNVLANDTLAGGPLPAGAIVAITVPPVLGAAAVNLDGTVTYTPNLNAAGTDAFSYTVTVNGFASNVATASITISPINDTPVAVADNLSVGVALPLAAPVTLNVFGNDTDPDGKGDLGAAINLTLLTAPAGATATLSGGLAGDVGFLPSAAGTYTFSYQAQDKGGLQVPTTILTSALPPAIVTVNVTAETIAITKAQYVVAQNRWVVSGTYAPTAATVTLSIAYANGTAAGTVIGTAPNVGGIWTLDFKPATGVLDPRTVGATQLRVYSPSTPPGGGALAPITLK